MKKSILFTVLFAISAFLSSAYAGVVTPINEVIVERGSNCYTAALDFSGKMSNEPANLFNLISKAVKSAFSFDYSSLLGFATIAGFAIVSSLDGEAIAVMATFVPLVWMKEEGKFIELEMEKFEELSKEDQLEYHRAFTTHRKAESVKIQEQIDGLVKKDGDHAKEIAKLELEIKENDIMKYEAMEKIQEEQGLLITKLMEKGTEAAPTLKSHVNKFIKDNISKIQDILKAGSGTISMEEVKAVGDMTTGSAALPVAAPALVGTQVAPAMNINLKLPFVDELITIFATSLAAYPYTESVPKEGGYDFIGEGDSKPQIDFKIETRWATPVKIAAHMILTEESVHDVVGLQSIANDYLKKQHDLKRQNGIFFGDGTGDNPKGATVYGRVFSAGALALKVVTPNIRDVIGAAVTDICTTHNYTDEAPYIANVALMNKNDFYIELVSAKDADGHPLYPEASLFNRVNIGGVLVIPFEDIPADKIFVADMEKYNVTNFVPYTVRIGFINDQFITNKFTMVGESRFHAFVKNLDEQAFLYDDIATIRTAITKA